MKDKVILFHPGAYLTNAPSVVGTITYLIDQNFEVVIFSDNNKIDLPDLKVTRVSILNEYTFLRSRLLSSLTPLFYAFHAKRIIKHYQPKFAIYIDFKGLYLGALTGTKHVDKKLYISLHIVYLKELLAKRRWKWVFMKLMEPTLIKRMNAIVSQDNFRLEELKKENNIKDDKIQYFLLPNTYRGVAQKTESTYFKQKFSISSPIILMAGAIADWSYPDFLAKAANHSTNLIPYNLVLQSNRPISLESKILKRIREDGTRNVYFSPTPIPFENLQICFSSAHIGVAIYTNEFEENQNFVGAASGKMMAYLRSGLPIIMMKSPGVTEIIDKYKCGILLDKLDVEEFNTAVRTIWSEYEKYSSSAITCFNEIYGFDNNFDSIFTFLKKGSNI